MGQIKALELTYSVFHWINLMNRKIPITETIEPFAILPKGVTSYFRGKAMDSIIEKTIKIRKDKK